MRPASSSGACRRITAPRSICQPSPNASTPSRARPTRCARTLDALAREGLPCAIVSGAGTGTFRLEGGSGLWSELQAGSYVFMDTEYARIGGKGGGLYTEFEHSLFVLATVMSVPAADRAIVDAGLKSYSGEKGMPWVHGRDDVEVIGISDEHGTLRVGERAERCGSATR